MKNIVLIGMPGCGKSTIGKRLSKETGLKFIDLDEYIVERNSMTIEEMFEKGEEFFRDREAEVVKEVSNNSRAIISTGGGVIKRAENIKHLKENGIIIFIDRSIEKIVQTLDDSKRPLLKDNIKRIYNLYEERYELYKLYSDIIISNDDVVEKTIKEVRLIIENIK